MFYTSSSGLPHKEMRVLTVVLLCYTAVLTASADVDLQVAFDNSAAFERLSSSHGVDDLPITYFITQTITSCAKHTGDRQRERQETVNVQRRSWLTSICQTGLAGFFFLSFLKFLSLKDLTSTFHRSSQSMSRWNSSACLTAFTILKAIQRLWWLAVSKLTVRIELNSILAKQQ